ncbi:hypothetical protein HGH92_02405 [Chitinophaga varians]|uniref:Uncharacterized protein n=1 Tax=Chitinophaga varians TaxID=2202339 RepID=A0A847RQI3_9BACT|nr:hypothetical protein [Chitinophaga varians]NLR63148.1 hypothetical protein [Chitinophaga varians]
MSYRLTKVVGKVVTAYRRRQEDPLFDWLVEDMQLLLREMVFAAHLILK